MFEPGGGEKKGEQERKRAYSYLYELSDSLLILCCSRLCFIIGKARLWSRGQLPPLIF